MYKCFDPASSLPGNCLQKYTMFSKVLLVIAKMKTIFYNSTIERQMPTNRGFLNHGTVI